MLAGPHRRLKDLQDLYHVSEIHTRSAMVRSKITGVDFVINPYLGCTHGCSYCYAAFMAKYARLHSGWEWGSFVEVKVNLVDALCTELQKSRKTGRVLLSSVCDPYQPVEKKYELTRQCLIALQEHGRPIEILTRSPLVVRDLDLLTHRTASVGLSIPTDSDAVRRELEPNAPSIPSRIEALRRLREAGVNTWVFIGPMLPMNPERLHAAVSDYAGHVVIDALNYRGRVRDLFLKNGWRHELTDEYARTTARALETLFGSRVSHA